MNDCAMVVRRLNCTIPIETFKKLEEICKIEDRKQSNVLKRMIEAEYERLKKK